MANYVAYSRSEDFRIKDVDALRADLKAWGVEHDVEVHITVDAPGAPEMPAPAATVYLTSQSDDGDWPSFEDDWVVDRLLYSDDDEVATRFGGYDLTEEQRSELLNELPHYKDVADLTDLIGKHLVPGEVAILTSVGHEKLRYVVGYATAVNAYGESHTVSLGDINEYARRLAQTPATSED